MRKKKYKVGDVFEMMLESGQIGYGRVLKEMEDTLLIEGFNINSFKNGQKKVILTQMCWNTSLKKGLWKIIDNDPVPENYQIPDFWGTNAIDGRYFKVLGSTVVEQEYENEIRKLINKEEINGMEKYGVISPKGFMEFYMERLDK